MMWKKTKPYVFFILLSLGVGALSAFLTRGNMDLYSGIQKPPLAPPAILFPIVWTVLYTLMGVSAARVYTSGEQGEDQKTGLFSFYLSLVVNFFWSIIFFNQRSFWFAFIWLLFLLFLIVRTIRYYKKTDALAAYLQIPYALWVSFAGYLNLAIALSN